MLHQLVQAAEELLQGSPETLGVHVLAGCGVGVGGVGVDVGVAVGVDVGIGVGVGRGEGSVPEEPPDTSWPPWPPLLGVGAGLDELPDGNGPADGRD